MFFSAVELDVRNSVERGLLFFIVLIKQDADILELLRHATSVLRKLKAAPFVAMIHSGVALL